MTVYCNNELVCNDHWEKIVNIAEDRYGNKEKLTYHKSISTIYAEELENQHIKRLVETACIVNYTHTGYEIEVDGQTKTVTGKIYELDTEGKAIGNAALQNNLDVDENTIDYNGAPYSYEDDKVTNTSNHFQLGDSSSISAGCGSLCIALPYKDVSKAPNALDWYSPLRWWDVLLLFVAGCIQFRLKSIEEGDGYGSYGPLVVDEKDIALTSIQLLTIIMSFFFYR